jgi:ABC-type multidrug transport system fused ATPase/permease subunit
VYKEQFAGRADPHGVVYYLVIFGALLVASNVFLLGRSFAMVGFAIAASRVIHRRLFQNILARSMSWFERTPVGRIVNRFTKVIIIPTRGCPSPYRNFVHE